METLKDVLKTLMFGTMKVSEAVETSSVSKAGSVNSFGEEQLKIDVLSDKLIQEEIRKNSDIGLIASEELENEILLGEGDYAVAYDPLDGSSLVDVNLTVGSIFGIYKLNGKKSFIGMKGDEQVAAMIALYGPRTTILLAVKGIDGVNEMTLKDGEFVQTRENLKIGEGKMFAPGNLRACKDNLKYLDLLNFWAREEYTLRYSGGMVPDVAQIILKGKGIFSYPGFSGYPNGKLRLLYECAPLAFLVEQAGGSASDGMQRILEKEITEISQRSPIYIGSNKEVDRCVKYLS